MHQFFLANISIFSASHSLYYQTWYGKLQAYSKPLPHRKKKKEKRHTQKREEEGEREGEREWGHSPNYVT